MAQSWIVVARCGVARTLGSVVLLGALTPLLSAQPGPTLVSTSSLGPLASGSSYAPVASADGRYVAFSSIASNLTPGDTNNQYDVFVRDMQNGQLVCVSLTPTGRTGNGDSYDVKLSEHGRFAAFTSQASNLVPGDHNEFADIFVFDLLTGLLERVSVNSQGREANLPCGLASLSGDGRYVAFESYSVNLAGPTHPGVREIFLRDRLLGTTSIASVGLGGTPANNSSAHASFSLDGSTLAFDSWAGNLVPDDSNSGIDVFVLDLASGAIRLVSVPSGGGSSSSACNHATLSADGKLVAFQSAAKNLVPGDTNQVADCFVRDLVAGTTERISLSTGGSQGDSHSGRPVISADGRLVVFHSHASNLVDHDTNVQQDVFVHDRSQGVTLRVSVDATGRQGDKLSSLPGLAIVSADVVFESWAENFFAGDNNRASDVFLRPLSEILNP